jgi:hypothetical protein
VIGRRAKKGHRKPIRRLAMTSILKQNTVCFALPLCRKYRQRKRAVSIAIAGNGQLEKYSRRAARKCDGRRGFVGRFGRVLMDRTGTATRRGRAHWPNDIQLVANLAKPFELRGRKPGRRIRRNFGTG